VDPSLVGWWKCDDGAGDTMADSSGRGFNGVLSGDVGWAEGQFGGALEFGAAGSDGLVSVPGDVWNTAWGASSAKEVTYMMWAYTDNASQTSVTVRAGPGLNLHVPWSGQIYWDVGSPVSRINAGNSDEWLAQWSHWAFTFTPGDQRIYLNGDLFVSGTASTPDPIATSAGTMIFGSSGAAGQGYTGLMDDIRLYNRALTQVEIQKLMLGIGDELASGPIPADAATDVSRDVVLGWTPGEFVPAVNGHIVYLSESFNDVNDGIGGISQNAASYVPAQRLELETTYYWRVDEVNGAPDHTVFKGDIWSFEVEPLAYPIINVTAMASSSQGEMGP